MKKSRLLLLTLLVALPLETKANGGISAPSYDAIITNPNGVTCKEKIVIPYNANVIVESEIYYENNWLANITYKNNEGELTCENPISMDDIKPIEYTNVDEYNIKDYGDEKIELMTYKEIKVFKGPSKKYEVIDTIPTNTKLSSNKGAGGYAQKESAWYYVEYNGINGWVYNSQSIGALYDDIKGLAFSDERPLYIATDKIKVYGTLNDENTANEYSIEKGTIIIPKYAVYRSTQSQGTLYAKIESNEITGWVDVANNEYIYQTSETWTTEKLIFINNLVDKNKYKGSAKNLWNEELLNIPDGTIIESKYRFSDMPAYLFEYNGKNYWYIINENEYQEKLKEAKYKELLNQIDDNTKQNQSTEESTNSVISSNDINQYRDNIIIMLGAVIIVILAATSIVFVKINKKQN